MIFVPAIPYTAIPNATVLTGWQSADFQLELINFRDVILLATSGNSTVTMHLTPETVNFYLIFMFPSIIFVFVPEHKSCILNSG